MSLDLRTDYAIGETVYAELPSGNRERGTILCSLPRSSNVNGQPIARFLVQFDGPVLLNRATHPENQEWGTWRWFHEVDLSDRA